MTTTPSPRSDPKDARTYEEWSQLGATIDTQLTTLSTKVDDCKRADAAETFGRPITPGCQQGINRLVADAGAALADLTSAYRDKLKPYVATPGSLGRLAGDTWTPMSQSLVPLVTEISMLQQTIHWTGRGADAYLKQLPTQVSALTEFSQFVDRARQGAETPALIHAWIYTDLSTQLEWGIAQISSAATTKVCYANYYERTARAVGVLRALAAYATRTADASTAPWKEAQSTHVAAMRAHGIASAEVLPVGSWPRATAATQASDIPATPAPVAPTSAPLPGPSAPPTVDAAPSGVNWNTPPSLTSPVPSLTQPTGPTLLGPSPAPQPAPIPDPTQNP